MRALTSLGSLLTTTSPWIEGGARWLGAIAIAATAICLLALVLDRVLGDRRALARSAVWHGCLAGLAILPFAMALLPRLELRVLPGRVAPEAGVLLDTEGFASRGPSETLDRTGLRASGSVAPVSEVIPPASRLPEVASARVGEEGSNGAMGVSVPPSPGSTREPGPHAVEVLPVALAVYLIVAILLGLRLVRALWAARRLRTDAVRIEDHRWLEALQGWRKRLGVGRQVHVLRSREASVPLVLGWLSPSILVPATLADRARKALRDSILVHELAHVRRGDWFWQVLCEALKAVYWCHPLAWLAGRRAVLVREEICDGVSAHALRSSRPYVESLLQVARTLAASGRETIAAPRLAMVRRARLADRIARIRSGFRLEKCLAPAHLRVVLCASLLAAASVVGSLEPVPAGIDGPAAAPKAIPSGAPTLEVVVLERESRKPLSGARIEAGLDERREDLRTNSDGIARIVPGTARTVWLRVESAGRVSLEASWDLRPGRDALPSRHVVALEGGALVGGRVVDDEGVPVCGAVVRIRADARGEGGVVSISRQASTTDADGRWMADYVPSALDALAIRITHPDHVSDLDSRDREQPSIESLRSRAAVSVLRRGLRLDGTVVDPEGRPVAGARVRRPITGGALTEDSPAVLGGPDGRFELRGLLPGGTTVVAEAEGFAPVQVHAIVKDDSAPLRIALARSRPLDFLVVDETGSPLEGATIHVNAWGALNCWAWRFATGSDGRVRWPGAPPGPFALDVYRDGSRSVRNRHVAADAREVRVVLGPPLTIRGHVLDRESREPIPEFRVIHGVAAQDGARPAWARDDARTFRGGEFELSFELYADGVVTLRVEAEGYAPQVSRAFRVDEGTQAAEFALVRATGPRGRVVGADGAPIAGARVILVPGPYIPRVEDGDVIGADVVERSASANGGKFGFPPQAEDFALVAVHDRGFAVSASDEFARSKDLRLVPWGRIEGLLLAGSRPLAGETVRLDRIQPPGQPRLASFRHEVRTDVHGRFVVERAAPGEYVAGRLLALGRPNETFQDSQLSAVSWLEVVSGRTASVEIGGGGSTVSGRLALVTGASPEVDWERGRVSLERIVPLPRERPATREGIEEWSAWYASWWPTEEAKTNRRSRWRGAGRLLEDGGFRLDGVPPGDYSLDALLRGPPRVLNGLDAPGPLIGSVSRRVSVRAPGLGAAAGTVDLGTIPLEAILRLEVGDPAPALAVETLEGSELRLESLRGKFVLVDFWATWCGPCQKEIPNLKAVHDTWGKDKRLVLVGLSLDANVEAWKACVRDNGMAWPQTRLGERSEVATAFGVRGVPACFLIGPDGRIAARDLSGSRLREVLRSVLESAAR